VCGGKGQALLFFRALELSVGKKINVLDRALAFLVQILMVCTISALLTTLLYMVCCVF